MYGVYPIKSTRKGIGSIIGGAFILLILIAGYMFFVFNSQAIDAQQKVLTEMRVFDIERSQEAFRSWKEPEYYLDSLNVTIQSVSPKPVYFKYVGVWDGVNGNWNYSQFDDIIMPGEEKEYNITVMGVQSSKPDWTYRIQFVTEKGNTYDIGYPDTQKRPIGNITTQVMAALAKYIGDTLPIYRTFAWAELDNNNRLKTGWQYDNWYIPASGNNNKKAIIMKIEIEYYGPGITIGSTSALFLQHVGQPPSSTHLQIYVVSESGNQFVKYNPISLNPFNNKTTLYFAASSPNDVPNFDFKNNQKGQYLTVLGLYDDNNKYAQSFPMIGIYVN